jgi:hypothetical protein
MIKRTTKDYKSIPAGSGIYIEKENKKSFRGTWSSMMGTYTVTIPKTHFEKEVSDSALKQRRYYENNRETWNEYQREYKKRKYAEDPAYRARMKEYQRVRRIEKAKNA